MRSEPQSKSPCNHEDGLHVRSAILGPSAGRGAALRSSGTALAFVAAVAAGGPAFAAAPRVVVVVDQFVDGERQRTSDAETLLIHALGDNRDAVLVDPTQAQIVRKASEGTPLTEVPPARLVTALEADILVIGEVVLDPADPGDFEDMVAYDGAARLRVVAVDSAQILGAVRAKRLGMSHTKNLAMARVSQDMMQRAVKEIMPLLERTDRYELQVRFDVPVDAAGADDVIRCVREHPDTREVRALAQRHDALKLELGSDLTPRELAISFGREAPCGLFVYAYSARALKADHAPEQLERIRLDTSRFRLEGRSQRRDRWVTRQLPRILQTELSAVSRLDPRLDAPLVDSRSKAEKGPSVRLGGSVRRTKGGFQITARVRGRGANLARGTASCSVEELAVCAGRLGRELAEQVERAIPRQAAALGLRGPRGAGQKAKTELKIEAIRVPGVYPARIGSYDRQAPVGEVEIRNLSEHLIEDIELEARLAGFSDRPAMVQGFSLEASSATSLPVSVWLDRARLAAHDRNRTVPMQIVLKYTLDGFRYRTTRSAPVVVYDRNAVHWAGEPESVAAFVDHRSPSVQQVVSQVQARLPDDLRADPLAVPAALFRALASLRYAKDAVNPFAPGELDYVLYPSQTLARGGGDCDDLAVLYAALLEGAGYPAMLVQTPGHVLVAVGLGRAKTPALRGAFSPGSILTDGGQVWLPLETTRVGQSFLDAWQHAQEELAAVRRSGGRSLNMVVREAWQTYPPVRLVEDDATETTASLVEELEPESWKEDWKALQAHRKELGRKRLSAARAGADAAPGSVEAMRLGVALAMNGDFDAARENFETGLEGDAARAFAQNNLGNLALLADRPDDAVRLYDAALKSRPKALGVALNGVFASYVWSLTDPEAEGHLARMMAQVDAIDPQALERLLSSLPRSASIPAAEASDVPLSGLALRLRRHLDPEAESFEGVTAQKAGDGPAVAAYLHWLP